MLHVNLATRTCVKCRKLCVEYDTADSARVPSTMRAAFPAISSGAQVCDPCDLAQHKPSEVRTFQLEAGMRR